VRDAGVALVWAAAAGALIAVLDLAQSLVADPRPMLPGGVLLVVAAVTFAFAAAGGALALVFRMTARRAVLTMSWLAAAVLALAGAGALGMTIALGPVAPIAFVGIALLVTLLARRWSFFARVAGAWLIVVLLVGVRHAVGVRCNLNHLDVSGEPAALTAEDRARPNVILVVLDTLRADHVSVNGGRREITPAIERFAAGGLVFSRAYAQASWTVAATASLLTSLFPSQHGHRDSDTRLSEDARTLPELLHGAGFTTTAFSANTHVTPTFGFGQGFETFHVCDDGGRGRSSLVLGAWKWADGLVAWLAGYSWFAKVERAVDGVIGNRRSDEFLVQAFTRWLRGVPRDRPFFAYLHMMSPHIPYDPSPEARKLFGAPANTKVRATPVRSNLCYDRGEELSPERRDELRTFYAAVVHDGDAFVGDVLAELERSGLDERTMVVVTADHGEEFSEHGNWGHGQSLYEELTRIPLVIRRPGGKEAGRHHDMPVMAVDVMPTILAEVGIPPPPNAVGRSLLDRGEGPVHDVVFSQIIYEYCDGSAVVADGWKYLEWRRDGAAGSELFDLAHDPGELAPTAPDGRQDLVGRLAQHRRETPGLYGDTSADGVSAQQQDRLRALGYVR
jgi:arylsulfatase A-like enzyme